MWNPPSDPLKACETQDERDELIFKYMKMWRDDEQFTDFNVFLEEGYDLLAADWLVSAGAVDSSACYESCRNIEREIEKLASEYRRLPARKREQLIDECLTGASVVVVECPQCDDGAQFVPEAWGYDATDVASWCKHDSSKQRIERWTKRAG